MWSMAGMIGWPGDDMPVSVPPAVANPVLMFVTSHIMSSHILNKKKTT